MTLTFQTENDNKYKDASVWGSRGVRIGRSSGCDVECFDVCWTRPQLFPTTRFQMRSSI